MLTCVLVFDEAEYALASSCNRSAAKRWSISSNITTFTVDTYGISTL